MTKQEFDIIIEKYINGQASLEEERLIDDFFNSYEKKGEIGHYELSEEIWSSIESQLKHKVHPGFELQQVHNKRVFSFRKVLVPLTILAIASLAIYFQFEGVALPPQESPWLSTGAQRGNRSLIILQDGSKVYLNSESTISYPEVFSKEKREIVLSGEAFFEVSTDAQRPFIVRTRQLTTRVLGTSFNVQAFPGEQISVTVVTGKVKVEAENSRNGGGKGKSASVMLKPNEQATYDFQLGKLTTSQVDVANYTAWMNNTLLFDNTSLTDAVEQLEKWYDVTIDFENDRIRNCTINGKYKNQSLEDILGSFQFMYDITYKITNQKKITLNGKGCNK